MTTWDDVQAAQDEVVYWRGFEKANGFAQIVQEEAYADALELLRLRLIDYRLTCLAHPGRLEDLGGSGGRERV